jgi:hypothetical protein
MTVSPWPFAPDTPETEAERRAALAPFDPKARGTWTWEQPSRWRARWVLAVDGHAVGELGGHGMLGTKSRATFAARTYTLQTRFPSDVLAPAGLRALDLAICIPEEPLGSVCSSAQWQDVLVFAEDGTEPLVRHRASWWGGGRFERAGQPALLWRRESFWRTRWGVHTGEKLPLVHVLTRPVLMRRCAGLELEDAARVLPDLDALLALAWYLAMRAQHHHGAH